MRSLVDSTWPLTRTITCTARSRRLRRSTSITWFRCIARARYFTTWRKLRCLTSSCARIQALVSYLGTPAPEDAARELARVCREGGRLGLSPLLPGSTLEGLFQGMRPYMPSPPASPRPLPSEWGKPERLGELLGNAFDLNFEKGMTTLRIPSGKAVWDLFVKGYGPTRTVAAGCDPECLAALEHDFIAYHEKFSNGVEVAMPREFLITIGLRR